nr:MAG: hypothetical protein [Crogonang virus 56]
MQKLRKFQSLIARYARGPVLPVRALKLVIAAHLLCHTSRCPSSWVCTPLATTVAQCGRQRLTQTLSKKLWLTSICLLFSVQCLSSVLRHDQSALVLSLSTHHCDGWNVVRSTFMVATSAPSPRRAQRFVPPCWARRSWRSVSGTLTSRRQNCAIGVLGVTPLSTPRRRSLVL